jgi:hypothetical protein
MSLTNIRRIPANGKLYKATQKGNELPYSETSKMFVPPSRIPEKRGSDNVLLCQDYLALQGTMRDEYQAKAKSLLGKENQRSFERIFL